LPARCLFISFDDGFREVYEIVAPILAEVGVPAGVFVITSAVDNHLLCYTQKKSLLIRRLPKITSAIVRKTAADVLNRAGFSDVDMASAICAVDYRQRDVLDELGRILECDYDDYLRTVRPYLTSEQLLRLSAQGFAIGAHSIDHPFYRDLSIEEQLRQTEESARWLSQGFGYHCQSFAFPFEDAGICEEFFVRAFSNGEVKVVFGGVGMRTDVRFPRYIPRFSMEKTDLPAAQIVARAYCKASLWRFQHCFDRS
jgi:peptidoglycan/xylan/chitin deacetylase (PgdA/CDA1 family)